MICWLQSSNRDSQEYCDRDFTEIQRQQVKLPSECGRSVDRRVPEGDIPAFGFFFLRNTLAERNAAHAEVFGCGNTAKRLGIPPLPEVTCQRGKLSLAQLKRTGSNPVEGFGGCRQTEWATGSGFDPEANVIRATPVRIPTTNDGELEDASFPSNRRSVPRPEPYSPPPDGKRRVQEEFRLEIRKRICSKCQQREVYLDIASLDWCEECLWRFLQA